MTYSLKYTSLSEVDLSGTHATGAWMTQPRIRAGKGGGRWTKGGGLWSGSPGPVAGKHAKYIDPTREAADSYQGVTVTEETSFSSVDWDGLFAKAADPNLSQTERESAARQATLHLEQMKRKVQVITPTSKKTWQTSSSKASVALKPVVKTEKFSAESVADATRVTLAYKIMEIGVRAAGAASVLIGAEQSEHLQHQLEHLSHNVVVHSAVTVAVGLVFAMLIGRIQKAMRERRDKRIARARGELQ